MIAEETAASHTRIASLGARDVQGAPVSVQGTTDARTATYPNKIRAIMVLLSVAGPVAATFVPQDRVAEHLVLLRRHRLDKVQQCETAFLGG
jgi:hypothetical protein